MFAVPVIAVDQSGEYEFFDGSLIQLDPELGGKVKTSRYAALTKAGWGEIDHGYFAFVKPLENGVKFVFAGILLSEHKPNKMLSQRTAFSKKQYESYFASIGDREKAHRMKAEDDLNALVHDLRRLSSSIYHAASAAKTALEKNTKPEVFNRLENIIATQSMLKIRTDVLDYAGNTSQIHDKEPIPVYRRIDKVVRCFTSQASAKGVTLQLIGENHSKTMGPNVFEIIPYVLIDNAIKYAPRNSEIRIAFLELDTSIEIHFVSLGPSISKGEFSRVFEKGYRGSAAKERFSSGSGIGLYLAKKLVEEFNGSISVEVDQKDHYGSEGPCKLVTFKVCVPKLVKRR